MLNPNTNQFETSVFRITSLNEDKIREIGDYVESVRNSQTTNPQNIKGYATIIVKDVKKTGLSLEKETSTHNLHANIVRWPMNREEKIELAIRLANNAIRTIN